MDAAGKNFSALRAMGNRPAFADEIFGFHVQQTGEKSLKAWLAFLGGDYPLTYDLAWLLGALREQGIRTAPFKWLIDYNPYAVQFRYMADPRIAPIDRDAAVRQLEALMEHVRRMLAGPRKAGDDK